MVHARALPMAMRGSMTRGRRRYVCSSLYVVNVVVFHLRATHEWTPLRGRIQPFTLRFEHSFAAFDQVPHAASLNC
jgi:hypothetical protein